jgi:hypothetical protein
LGATVTLDTTALVVLVSDVEMESIALQALKLHAGQAIDVPKQKHTKLVLLGFTQTVE